ncbi:MAG TPA: hypothetical protein VGG48_00905 [Rhizomicrobium sp.]
MANPRDYSPLRDAHARATEDQPKHESTKAPEPEKLDERAEPERAEAAETDKASVLEEERSDAYTNGPQRPLTKEERKAKILEARAHFESEEQARLDSRERGDGGRER